MPRGGLDRKAYRSAKFGSWEKSLALDSQVAHAGRDAGLRFVRRSRKAQSGGFTEGTEDVRLLLLLGREDEALQRLERAVASGWMFFSFGLHFTRIYDPVRDDPRFIRAVATLAATMERERAWYEAHRDDPVESML